MLRRRILWIGSVVLLVSVMVVAVVEEIASRSRYRGLLYDPPRPAPEFALRAAANRLVRLSDLRGKVVLLYFGYTACPDVCPTTLSDLRRVQKSLGARASQVQVVHVTVDPERDTPERLHQYLSGFHPDFLGLSGSLDELKPVWQAYGVVREVEPAPQSALGYFVNHSARVYLIDPEGRLFLSYAYGTPPEDILYDVQLMLK